MEENKDIVEEVKLSSKDFDEKDDVCVCDMVNNNIDIIKQMRQRIEELEYIIKNNSHCICGKLFIKNKNEKNN